MTPLDRIALHAALKELSSVLLMGPSHRAMQTPRATMAFGGLTTAGPVFHWLHSPKWDVPKGLFDDREGVDEVVRTLQAALSEDAPWPAIFEILDGHVDRAAAVLGNEDAADAYAKPTSAEDAWFDRTEQGVACTKAPLVAVARVGVLVSAARRAELVAPWQGRTVRASTAIVRTMSSAIGTKKTVGLLDSIEVSSPKGATLALFAAHGPGKESLAERLSMQPHVLKTYLATMMAAFDQGNPDLSFTFSVEECVEEYWGRSGGMLRAEVQKSIDALQSIDVVAAGKWRAGKGQTQHLINRISNGKTQRFEHCFLMRAALGCYAQVDDHQKEMMKEMAPKTEMVQFPRAIMRAEERAFPLAIGGALLVRDSLTQLRKTGDIIHSPEHFLATIGRTDAAKKRGTKAEIAYAAKVLDESEIGTVEVMPDGRIKTHVSLLLVDAYATTMAGAARGAAAAAKKGRAKGGG